MKSRRKAISSDRKVSRLVDGTNSLSITGFERDTTLGENKATFPSMHESEQRLKVYPVNCPFCGITHKYATVPNLEEGCTGLHSRIEKIMFRK